MDGGGTIAWMREVEPRRRPTWMWGGRATHGAVAGSGCRGSFNSDGLMAACNAIQRNPATWMSSLYPLR
mgnify:FL=1